MELNDQYRDLYYKNFDNFPFDSCINKLKEFYGNYIKSETDILHLVKNSKQMTPFKMRRQKPVHPNNKCLCAINYRRNQVCKLEN